VAGNRPTCLRMCGGTRTRLSSLTTRRVSSRANNGYSIHMSTQASFTEPEDRSREIIKRCSEQYDEAENVILTVSGGTDSVVAADLVARIGPEYGIEPDAVAHIDTGTGIPQSRLVARLVAEMHDLDFIVQGYRQDKNSLANRILGNGWPGAYGGSPVNGGHGLEWANRKDKPMNAVYMMFEGLEIWVSGARRLESKQRSGNVPDSGIEQDRPRRIWLSPISGWTSSEKATVHQRAWATRLGSLSYPWFQWGVYRVRVR